MKYLLMILLGLVCYHLGYRRCKLDVIKDKTLLDIWKEACNDR